METRHKNDDNNDEKKKTTEVSKKNDTPKKDKPTKDKTPKQKWTAYTETHALGENAKLPDEPDEAINQTDSKSKYRLTPADLGVLPYFPKPNPKYGNTTKLFQESEVKTLAYRKAAVLGGVGEGEDAEVLKKGRELFEKEK